MNKWYYLILVVFIGCASKPEVVAPKPDKPTAKTPPSIFGENTQPTNIPTNMTIGTEPNITVVKQVPKEKIIYFEYDMSTIKLSAKIILKKHITYLIENPDIFVRLEGHADERGSTEYNLALGELRAEATKEALMNLGIPEEQVDALSYGEEQPIVRGHGEESWQLNRRVEFVYP
jgi:peptidoglycan-associated lipoprotein